MRSLEEHNSERWKLHNHSHQQSPRHNGIACPDCGEELFDKQPWVTFTSSPAKKEICCPCGYEGMRIA